ncbi:MAG: TerB family tellurite resistance protein [Bacteroidia bacterium]|jgi:uncharacterized tellurite resistance protein B-like protein
MNKITAGYKMLMILANVDGQHLEQEHSLIIEYLGSSFDPRTVDATIKAEQLRIQALPQESQMIEFREAMNYFYSHSTSAERSKFLQLAMDLIKSDEHITREENIFINKLFDAWGETE